jgi:polysaccharide deacetylase family protein (PEP-CTERM system associated)
LPNVPRPRQTFLFSIDLEDVRSLFAGGHRYAERVPPNTERLLAFLARHRARCTFFTTGDVARRYPSLLRDVASAGHEIACHTSDHTPLDRLDPTSLRSDIERFQDDLARAGVAPALGFRAPYGSMIAETAWAYSVLVELGFAYSASVLPGPSPLYGWPEFGPDRPRMQQGLLEIPATLAPFPKMAVPFMSGIYFRLLPFTLVRFLFQRRLSAGDVVASYLHPFDIDTEQERFPFPDMNAFYGWLMYRRRAAVLPRLDRIFASGVEVTTYAEYAASYRATAAETTSA